MTSQTPTLVLAPIPSGATASEISWSLLARRHRLVSYAVTADSRGNMFNLRSCAASAKSGALQDWVLEYLSSGYWANIGLRDGLLLHKRYWIGPLAIKLSILERCCGPEEDMTYHVPPSIWTARIEDIAASLANPEELPPLIVEWRDGHLFVCDGSHRLGAMLLKGWERCFVVIWCNSPEDYAAAVTLTC